MYNSSTGSGFWEQRASAGRRGNHTNTLKRALQLFTQAARSSTTLGYPYATGSVPEPSRIWLCALRRGCAATELGPLAPPRRPARIGGRWQPGC